MSTPEDMATYGNSENCHGLRVATTRMVARCRVVHECYIDRMQDVTKKHRIRNTGRFTSVVNAARQYEHACDGARLARAEWARLTLAAVQANTGEAWEAANMAERNVRFHAADERGAENLLTDLATVARNVTGRAATMRGAIELRHKREDAARLEDYLDHAVNNGAASMRGKE